jgi:hypothetical protein
MSETSALARFKALVSVRRPRAHAVSGARRQEGKVRDELERLFSDLAAATKAYAGADRDEAGRLRVRELAGLVAAQHAAVDEAHASVVRAVGELRAVDEKIARAARDLHDPVRVRAASPHVAIGLMPPDVALACAFGDAPVSVLRAFLDAVEAHHAASAFMRAEGSADSRPVAWTIFLVPMLEAFARRGVCAVDQKALWWADSLAPTTPQKLVDWLRERSDQKPDAVRAAHLLAMLLRIRSAVAIHGVRDGITFETLDRARAGEHEPAATAAEDPPPRSLGGETPSGWRQGDSLSYVPPFIRPYGS